MSLESIFNTLQEYTPKHPYLLRDLLVYIHKSPANFDKLLDTLKTSKSAQLRLKTYLQRVFVGKDITYILIESGIPKRTSFIAEIIRKIKHILLPELTDKSTFHQTIALVNQHGKYRLTERQLAQLLDILEIQVDFKNPHLQNELIDAIEILSYRITASVIESNFIQKFKHNKTLSSFIKQNKEIHGFIAQHTLGVYFNPNLIEYIQQLLKSSLADIDKLKKLSSNQGASLQLTYSLNRITYQIKRLDLLLNLYANPRLDAASFAKNVLMIIKNERKKNSIRDQINETTYLLAHQITEHESKTGEHYIAENKKDYLWMFRSSCRGGIFASLMTLIKIFIHHMHFAPFWQAFSYSINYAAGFVGIQVSHATLATKQPAMTASRIALSLHKKGTEENTTQGLALMIGKVSRSQFISFVGNLIIVFPLSFAIAWLYSIVAHHNLVSETEAKKMLDDVHPYLNPTWFYASITGVYLFLSGIISGYYDNKVIYSNIPQRARQHPLLKRILTKRMLINFSNYIEHNLGSLIGNIALGFFLGTTSFFGFIFGLPIDIRHITISSGNYAIALFTLMETIHWEYALVCLTGVLGIGLFNFAISFGLAIFVAARSRKLVFNEFKTLLIYTGKYFIKYPLDFIRAPKIDRTIEDLALIKE